MPIWKKNSSILDTPIIYVHTYYENKIMSSNIPHIETSRRLLAVAAPGSGVLKLLQGTMSPAIHFYIFFCVYPNFLFLLKSEREVSRLDWICRRDAEWGWLDNNDNDNNNDNVNDNVHGRTAAFLGPDDHGLQYDGTNLD